MIHMQINFGPSAHRSLTSMTIFLHFNLDILFIYALREREAELTIEDFIKLSWWGMDDKVGCYAYLQRQD